MIRDSGIKSSQNTNDFSFLFRIDELESHTRLLKGNCLTKLGQHKVYYI